MWGLLLILASGVWSPQTEALFDVCICDTDAQSYLCHTPASKYFTAASAHRVHFTLFYFSVDGLAGPEAFFSPTIGCWFGFVMGVTPFKGPLLDWSYPGFCPCESNWLVHSRNQHQMAVLEF